MINRFITLEMEKYYPIPIEFKEKVQYGKILYDGSKAFYYDKDYNFLCEVEYDPMADYKNATLRPQFRMVGKDGREVFVDM